MCILGGVRYTSQRGGRPQRCRVDSRDVSHTYLASERIDGYHFEPDHLYNHASGTLRLYLICRLVVGNRVKNIKPQWILMGARSVIKKKTIFYFLFLCEWLSTVKKKKKKKTDITSWQKIAHILSNKAWAINRKFRLRKRFSWIKSGETTCHYL